jgi:hypothetical protein
MTDGASAMSATATAGRHRVVIVGCGFGGLFAAKALRRAAVDVTVIDRTNHHLFQPLLYQLATGILSEGDIAPPIRDVLRHQRNTSVVLGEVAAVDLNARRLTVDTVGLRGEIPYDSLIVATGASQSYFGHPEFAHDAPGMKTIDHALELRGRIFGAFEMAEREPDPAARRQWLTFVVVGAGPTGVELAGQLVELSRWSLQRNFRRVDASLAPAYNHTLDMPEKSILRVNILADPRLQHALLCRIDDHAWRVDVVDDAAHLRYARGDFLGGGAHSGSFDLAVERHNAALDMDDDARMARSLVARERLRDSGYHFTVNHDLVFDPQPPGTWRAARSARAFVVGVVA